MADTVFPYDDEVADPYAADDTKNPHEESGPAGDDGDDEESTPKKRPGRARKAT